MKNPCNAVDAVTFIHKFRADCGPIAKQLGGSIENILGLAVQESEYGGEGRIAFEYNNYFSMHAPAPLQIRVESARKDSKVKIAVYSSFSASAQSLVMRYGSFVKGVSGSKKFAEALIRARFNSGSAKNGGRDGFASNNK